MIAGDVIRHALAAAALLLGLCGTAQAACEGSEVPLEQYDNPGMRAYLASTIEELETYYQVSFPAACMSASEYGAYVDLSRDGTLVMGTDFIWGVAEHSLNHVTAVLAHETAHRFQSVHNLLDKLTMADQNRVKCIELHADFMAGGFMRRRSEYMKVKPDDLAAVFFDLGDEGVHDYDHHGLGPERYVAFAAGFGRLFADVYENATTGMFYVSRAKCDPA
ncbi:MAG TPA: hypothetical protein PK286_10325 [Devosia sp.]|nr:hypothetical protein [Devosia sp.]